MIYQRINKLNEDCIYNIMSFLNIEDVIMNNILLSNKLTNYKFDCIKNMFIQMFECNLKNDKLITLINKLMALFKKITVYVSGGYILEKISNIIFGKNDDKSCDIDLFISKKDYLLFESDFIDLINHCLSKKISYICSKKYKTDSKIITSPDIFKIIKIYFTPPQINYINSINNKIFSIDIIITQNNFSPKSVIRSFDIGICRSYITNKGNFYVSNVYDIINKIITAYNVKILNWRYSKYVEKKYITKTTKSYYFEYNTLIKITKEIINLYIKDPNFGLQKTGSLYNVCKIKKVSLPFNFLFGQLDKNYTTKIIICCTVKFDDIHSVQSDKYVDNIYLKYSKLNLYFDAAILKYIIVFIENNYVHINIHNYISKREYKLLNNFLNIIYKYSQESSLFDKLNQRKNEIIEILMKTRKYYYTKVENNKKQFISNIHEINMIQNTKKITNEHTYSANIEYEEYLLLNTLIHNNISNNELFSNKTTPISDHDLLNAIIKSYIVYELIKHYLLIFNTINKQLERIIKYTHRGYKIHDDVKNIYHNLIYYESENNDNNYFGIDNE